METLTWVGISIYMMGHGARGLPNTNLLGCVAMIVGGALVLIGALT